MIFPVPIDIWNVSLACLVQDNTFDIAISLRLSFLRWEGKRQGRRKEESKKGGKKEGRKERRKVGGCYKKSSHLNYTDSSPKEHIFSLE
jgi:hypothetical protein